MEKRYCLPKDLVLENRGIYALVYGIEYDEISAPKHHAIYLHWDDKNGHMYHLVDTNSNKRNELPNWLFEDRVYNPKESDQLALCFKMGNCKDSVVNKAGFDSLHNNIAEAFKKNILIEKNKSRDNFNCTHWFLEAVEELGEIGLTVSIGKQDSWRYGVVEIACEHWKNVKEVTVI